MNSLLRFLACTDIPGKAKSSDGFLEIIGKQFHENINSKLYAHFINTEELGISSAFVDALVELIEEKTSKRFSLLNPQALTEVTTQKGRLDILVRGESPGSLGGRMSILIENKLFFWLHNDLMDYWESTTGAESSKIGILLTLREHFIPHHVRGKFINITHIEWVRKIKEKGLPESLPLNHSYRVYLADFFQTIERMTKSYAMNEQTRFYFEHTQQVLKAQETIEAAHEFINNQFELIAAQLGWESHGNSMIWRNFREKSGKIDVWLTILIGELMNGKKMEYTLVLELRDKAIERANELNEMLQDDSAYKEMSPNVGNKHFYQFACKNYTLTPEGLEKFADNVVSNIRKDFAGMTLRTIKHLHPDQTSFDWEELLLGKNQV